MGENYEWVADWFRNFDLARCGECQETFGYVCRNTGQFYCFGGSLWPNGGINCPIHGVSEQSVQNFLERLLADAQQDQQQGDVAQDDGGREEVVEVDGEVDMAEDDIVEIEDLVETMDVQEGQDEGQEEEPER